LDTYMVDTYYSDHDLLISKIIIHYWFCLIFYLN
jgi:hypothetical protein